MPNVMPDHVIVMTEDADGERTSWECSCGRAGSAASFKVDLEAERHVSEGESVAHRTAGGGAW
jgi:hypothetical protein